MKKYILISIITLFAALFISEYLKVSCGNYLKDVYIDSFQIYFQQSFFRFDLNNILCSGSVLNVDSKNEVITVLFNDKFYLLASQIFLLFIFLVQQTFLNINTKKLIILYVLMTVFIQLILNLNFGLNLFNEISVQQLLFFVSIGIFLNEKN